VLDLPHCTGCFMSSPEKTCVVDSSGLTGSRYLSLTVPRKQSRQGPGTLLIPSGPSHLVVRLLSPLPCSFQFHFSWGIPVASGPRLSWTAQIQWGWVSHSL
jgi:hypothetical protein